MTAVEVGSSVLLGIFSFMKNPDNHIAHALGERSGQYTVSSKKPALIILSSTAKEKATKALNALRGGANYEVEDLDDGEDDRAARKVRDSARRQARRRKREGTVAA